MFLSHSRVLEKIINYKGIIAIWGLSDATKRFFTKYPNLCESFFCIIDNDVKRSAKLGS
ncbi:hypothetical protein [Aliarcobacter cryaerophilus]|uniref:hypothetical protein n=1 Tax=Aliarcobacter cryaerophilus TaxID=28198 RepID=UPI003DA580A6